MAYNRRIKKVSHDGVLNVFDLDDDIEELSLAVDEGVKDKRSVNKTTKQPLRPKYVDPLANRNYVDPLSNSSIVPISLSNSPPTDKNPKTNGNDTKVASNGISTQRSSASSVSTRKEQQTTQSVQPKAQPHQRNPTFASNYSNRSIVTQRTNKNQKGFGHDEHDMVVDDVEEF